MPTVIDHQQLAEERLASQFKESTNLINYIKSLLQESNNLEQVYQDLVNSRYIDTAVGVQLDIIGSIVGQPRILIDGALFVYFGFFGNSSADTFGTLKDNSVGALMGSVDTVLNGDRVLTDDEYRVFIRSKIIKNYTLSTPEDIIAQHQFLFDTQQIIFEDGDTEYTISIGSELTRNEINLLVNTDIMAKTAGVRVNYKISYDYDKFFSFEGIPNSAGFGSVNSPELGGKFGRLINI